MSASLAAAAAASSQAQVQMAVAAKIAKMNAGAERSVVDLLTAAQQNIESIVSAAPAGTGNLLDISV